jgi:hypothetical protein
MSKQSQNTVITALKQSIAGVQKRFPNATLLLGGTTFTTAQLVGFFQSLIDAITAAVAAKAARAEAVANLHALEPKVMTVHGDLLAFVEATLGRSATVLADFGKQPSTRKTPTAAEKAAAVQKREATRAARHTAGPVQKKAVKGTATPPAQPSASGSATTATTPKS